MLKKSYASTLVVAALLALATLLVLPAVLAAKTEPPLAEVFPSRMANSEAEETTNSEAEETTTASSSRVDEADDGSNLHQLALEKLTVGETTPAPEPVPEKTTSKKEVSKRSSSRKQASKRVAPAPAPVRKRDKASKRVTRAGAAKKNAPAPQEAPVQPTSAAPVHTAKPGPSGNRLLLSVPRLGLENLKIRDSSKQSYLDREGIMHFSGTGFPSQHGSNTYIAGHAEGYITTRIPHVFRNLKDLRQGDHISLRDSTGRTYDYRVYESFVVTPYDFWVTKPVAGKQIVSLQTCFPAPTYDKRLIVRGMLVN